jgi:hypothetical protein
MMNQSIMNSKTLVATPSRDGACVSALSEPSVAIRKWRILVADDDEGMRCFMEKPLNIPILVRAIRRLISEDTNHHLRRITDRAFVTSCSVALNPKRWQLSEPLSGDKT